MGMFDVLKISASALKAERTRMEIIASNLANIHTTRTEEGGPYKKKEVVFTAVDVMDGKGFGKMLSEKIEGVKVEEISESSKSFERVHDPGHPDADPDGYVTYPNVNLMDEMTDMTAATRAYEANINVVSTTKEMFLKALEIAK
ncbi:flagellar basal body rod protein FlgC [Syntrophorhabdus aromaticivorans]|uniref:Flagellar basal-body rod protein FlgC n=1 Tax=Syntrophorhabdus aromaticivorans TaxID=328301 RepID=A0A351U6D7_9BACT|nr:flagellar basal body rod protein FlgC [Syntrophorhabdus aromaticivorans]NLW34872.1 flagellar basal body rod protein FlgC [Syntrophorhabdus aromaticivorans]HBA55518.1 flagellar basal body rod protein FlgC [Syntrophorhabdus aromaticivorans]